MWQCRLVCTADWRANDVLAMSPFFMMSLNETSPLARHLDRWMEALANVSPRLVCVPVCDYGHWRLVIIDIKQAAIEVYNSLGNAPEAMKLGSLICGWADVQYPSVNFTVRHVTEGDRHQRNGHDCGAFVLVYAFLHAAGFSPEEIASRPLPAAFVSQFRDQLHAAASTL
jgi:Ulp1 family protease